MNSPPKGQTCAENTAYGKCLLHWPKPCPPSKEEQTDLVMPEFDPMWEAGYKAGLKHATQKAIQSLERVKEELEAAKKKAPLREAGVCAYFSTFVDQEITNLKKKDS